MMENTLRAAVVKLSLKYGEATDTSLATISKRSLNDTTFFTRLDNGRGFNIRTYDRVIRWLSDNWPEALEWPAEIERPSGPQPETHCASSKEGAAA